MSWTNAAARVMTVVACSGLAAGAAGCGGAATATSPQQQAAARFLAKYAQSDGRMLPPDWAELTAAGALRSEPAPDGSQPQTQYGLDAQRVVVWSATSCDKQARALAARW